MAQQQRQRPPPMPLITPPVRLVLLRLVLLRLVSQAQTL
jgi:hypothetical protein